jgi:hypothetical protein
MNGASLAQLRDIHTAPTPGVWPPAPGWWLAALLVLATGLVLGRRLYRRYRRWRRQRIALAELVKLRASFQQDHDLLQLAAGLSVLLRRVALSRFPRPAVAGLSGMHWLSFLDATGGSGQFANGPGRVLATAPYRPGTELDVEGLYGLVEAWIKQNA